MNNRLDHQIYQIRQLLKDRYLTPALRIVFTRKLKALEAQHG
jgi:hypothetical protein